MEAPKVVQIAVTRSSGERHDVVRLVILADNGEVWRMDESLGSTYPWVRVILPWEQAKGDA